MWLLMGEARLALGWLTTEKQRETITLVALKEPQDLTFSAGQRPEGLYAVLHKKHWIGFQVSTFGGAGDRFLVQTRGVSSEDMPKRKATWQPHLAGFRHEFWRHGDMPEPGLCGWRLLQEWSRIHYWDTNPTARPNLLSKEDKELILRSKIAWRQAGPAAGIRATFLAHFDTCPQDDQHWAASGGAPEVIPVDPSPLSGQGGAQARTTSNGTNGAPDPWASFDPWQKRKPVRQSRWEDLELPQDHLSFVRKQELGPAEGGIAFSTKSNLQHLIEAKPKALAAALLPQLAAEDPLCQLSSVSGPIEVTVFDPALSSNYKRQVHLVTLSQSTDAVCHSLPTPAISLTIADVAELIIECDARVVSKDLFNAFNDNPIHRFKTVLKEHCEVDFCIFDIKSQGKTNKKFSLHKDATKRHSVAGKTHHFHTCAAQIFVQTYMWLPTIKFI